MLRSAIQRCFGGLSKNTFLIALASLFSDISAEMLYPVLPVFLTQTLGATGSIVGLVDGFAQAAQSLVQGFSGALSDKLQKRKSIALAGYLLSAAAKPLMGAIDDLARRVRRPGECARRATRPHDRHRACEDQDRTSEPHLQHPPTGDSGTSCYCMTRGVRPLRTTLSVRRPKSRDGADQAAPEPRNIGCHGQRVTDRPNLRGALDLFKDMRGPILAQSNSLRAHLPVIKRPITAACPTSDHSASDLALPPLHPEPARRRRFAGHTF